MIPDKVPRYDWDAVPKYFVTAAFLENRGLELPRDRVGLVCYSNGNCCDLYDLRQAPLQKLPEFKTASEKRLKQRILKTQKSNAFQALLFNLEFFERELNRLIQYLDDENAFSRCLPRSERIERVESNISFLLNIPRSTSENLIVFQKLTGKHPQPTDVVLGGKKAPLKPKPWDAVLGTSPTVTSMN